MTTVPRWRRPMIPRDPDEDHRQASFLELFFDLCFVVAIAQVAAELHHALADDHVLDGVVSYVMVFFAIWWAWMNFTWLASAYDNDDVLYRLATFVQIGGALVLAAGVPAAFAEGAFGTIFVGYLIMRVGLVYLWIRAARHDPDHRGTALRYAVGISVVMLGWGAMAVTGYWPVWGFWIMAACELAIPLWAERAGQTAWHRDHIAERYGLFTIIVLGESILAATGAVQVALGEHGAAAGLIAGTVGGGLLLVFSMWWLYFAHPADRVLTSYRAAFAWGYGHYLVFASAAAVGAGLAVSLDRVSGHAVIGDVGAAAAVTVPVALYLVMLRLLQVRADEAGRGVAAAYPVAAALVLGATFTPWPLPVAGAVTAGLVALTVAAGGTAARDGRVTRSAERPCTPLEPTVPSAAYQRGRVAGRAARDASPETAAPRHHGETT